MYKSFKDNRGEIDPTLMKAIVGGFCVVVLASVGISILIDHKNDTSYQKWAREENQKVFDKSQQVRLSNRQLVKIKRQLNDSFYQRLDDGLPVRILVVGDAYGYGYGASNKSVTWSKLLAAELKLKYGINAEIYNVSLSGMDGGYSAWAQLMSQPDGTAAKTLEAAGAVIDESGNYTGDSVDNKTIYAARKSEYDLCIISLGMTDHPAVFNIYYEGVLRELRNKYQKCSVITLLSNQAITAPDAGYADDNMEALYSIADHYKSAVINVGLEMTEPDAAASGATISELPYSSYTTDNLASSMIADGISEKKVAEIADEDLSQRIEAAQKAIDKYTIDGLYLNNDGQDFLTSVIMKNIDKAVKAQVTYDKSDIQPLIKDVVTLDQYYYFPVSKFKKLDDYTYVLAKNTIKASGSGLKGIVGVDYALVPGQNDLYMTTGDGTHSFGRLNADYAGSSNEHTISVINDMYSCDNDGNIYIGFATKEQANTLHGVILGGDFVLPDYLDDYPQVPYIGPIDSDGNRVSINDDGELIKSDSSSDSSQDNNSSSVKPSSSDSASTYESVQSTAAAQTETAATTTEAYNPDASEAYETSETSETLSADDSSTKTQDESQDAVAPSVPTDDSDSGNDTGSESDDHPQVPETSADTSDSSSITETVAGQALSDEQIAAILESAGSTE